MLQPTPSPLQKCPEKERKQTVEEQEEELERERTQTLTASVSTAHFRPMTPPEAGEMPEQYDYLQLCEDITIDWSRAMVPGTSLRVAPSRYGCYRGGRSSGRRSWRRPFCHRGHCCRTGYHRVPRHDRHDGGSSHHAGREPRPLSDPD